LYHLLNDKILQVFSPDTNILIPASFSLTSFPLRSARRNYRLALSPELPAAGSVVSEQEFTHIFITYEKMYFGWLVFSGLVAERRL
jgi:hypothetical protein